MLAGVVTAVPLLLFAAAARRLPLVTVGLIQFITPVLQLLVGVLVLGEHMSARLWVGFGIVWVALVLLSIDSLRTRERRAHRAAAGRGHQRDGRHRRARTLPLSGLPRRSAAGSSRPRRASSSSTASCCSASRARSWATRSRVSSGPVRPRRVHRRGFGARKRLAR